MQMGTAHSVTLFLGRIAFALADCSCSYRRYPVVGLEGTAWPSTTAPRPLR